MKIASLSIQSHPVLDNIAIDFRDSTGEAFDIVIIAGSNGTGKTAILELIANLFQRDLSPGFGKITSELEFNADEKLEVQGVIPYSLEGVSKFEITWNSHINNNWSAYHFIFSYENGERVEFVPEIYDAKFSNLLKVAFSEVAIDFVNTRVDAVRASQLDSDDGTVLRSGGDLGKQIAQLLVDIRATDNEELANWSRENPGLPIPDEVRDVRMRRFTQAFEFMFPSKRLESILGEDGRQVIKFSEFGKKSNLEQLSTGEKQIVFRAGFLLKNRSRLKNAILLIDEPELSLHPDWQEKIVGFYSKILADENGMHPQIFIATHSPFIVHGTPNSRVVILERNAASGAIQEMSIPQYADTTAKKAVHAFSMNSLIKGSAHRLIVACEGASDCQILEHAWSNLRPGVPQPFEPRSLLGAKNINIMLNDQTLASKLGDKRLVAIFDFDSAFDHWNGVWKKVSVDVETDEIKGVAKKHNAIDAWAALLPVPQFRSDYASLTLKGKSILSIEFLFPDEVLPSEMLDNVALPMGRSYPVFKDSKKSEFASMVGGLGQDSFASFEPLIQLIERAL
jgi:ABC-type Mn2+/Zn2+ transport system ATPase subunit